MMDNPQGPFEVTPAGLSAFLAAVATLVHENVLVTDDEKRPHQLKELLRHYVELHSHIDGRPLTGLDLECLHGLQFSFENLFDKSGYFPSRTPQ